MTRISYGWVTVAIVLAMSAVIAMGIGASEGDPATVIVGGLIGQSAIAIAHRESMMSPWRVRKERQT